MDESKKNKFFLLVSFHKIKFTALNENNEILLDKEIISNDSSYKENLITLQNFLDKYFFDLEKKLNKYKPKNVLIHDAARPFCSNILITKILLMNSEILILKL